MGFLPKDYVTVSTRLEEFHKEMKDNKKETPYSISTQFDIRENIVSFQAILINKNGDTFMGSSFGKVGVEKAFEKLETVAVGRALAFAGYHVKDGIASREEMDNFETNQSSSPSKPVTKKEWPEDNKPWLNDKDIDKMKDMIANGTLGNDQESIKEHMSQFKVSRANRAICEGLIKKESVKGNDISIEDSPF